MAISNVDQPHVPEIDLTDPAVVGDPVAAYGDARERSSVARLVGPGFDMWAVTRHEPGRRMLADSRFRLQADSYQRPDVPEDCVPYLRTMQEIDGAEHARLRRLVAPAFTPQRTMAFRPRIAEIVERLIDGLVVQADGGTVDLLPHFARPLPMDVISALVGIPDNDRLQWREYGAAVAAGQGQQFAEALPAIIDAAKAVVSHRRREPADDLVSALLQTKDEDGDRLDDVELVTLVWHLVLAGQTPTNLVANAIAALFAHPEQLAALRADPALMPRAVDELVRWCGPQLLTIPRFAVEDVEIDGTAVRPGDRVTVAIAAANRDPRVFAASDRLDITCTDPTPGHLGFAHGPHFCLGAPLARMQTEIALSALLTRFPDLAPLVPPEEITYVPDPGTWRLSSLPVTL
jgi:cytochrome P450